MLSTRTIKSVDKEYLKIGQARLDSLTKPPGSLGRLEEFARRLVGIYRNPMPKLPKKVIFTFAGDHGVTAEGVSAFPAEVTPQMVFNFIKGGAGINVLAVHTGADVVVIDIGVNYDFPELTGLMVKKVVHGTKNIAKGPAMTLEETLRCIETGIDLAREYYDLGYRMFATGEMGIGNTTPSAAIASVMTGRGVEEVTGRGTGIDDKGLANKIDVIRRAISINRPDKDKPIEVLAKLGGAEIAGITGLCLGAAECGVPIVVDGFISTAGAIIAYAIDKKVGDYIFAAHRSEEIGHTSMLKYMGQEPILDLGLRLGEGTGAALAMGVLDASLKIYREMATFQEAGVSDKT